MKPLSIAVVGCGVAGMAAATLLADDGHDVVLYERFAVPQPLGAGLLLQPTGLKALARLGLLDAVYAAGAEVRGIDARTVGGRRVLDLAYADLGPACVGLGIHRGALFQLLFDRLGRSDARLVAGAEVADFEEGMTGVTLRTLDGAAHGPHDLVLIANGAHSALRGRIGVERRAPVYPWGCAFATVVDVQDRFAGLLRQRLRSTSVMIGVLPVAPQLVTLFWSLRVRDMQAWRAAGLDSWRSQVRALWPDIGPLLDGIDSMEKLTLATYRDVAVRPWSRGRIGVIGDAAHGTSPQLGQGANMALGDAVALVEALRDSAGPADALAETERRRRARVDYYRLSSRWLTPFYQSDRASFGWLRDLAFGPACRLPVARRFMLTTLAGLRRGWFSCDGVGEDGLPE